MAKSDYVEGRKFRVLREGARFEGLLLHGEQTISGWSRHIAKGEILTCLGWKDADALGTQIKGVMWTGVKVPDTAISMQIWPFESLFRPYPMDGLLEIYVDPDDEEQMLADLQATPSIDEIDDGQEVDLTTHLPVIDRPMPEPDDEVVDLTDGY